MTSELSDFRNFMDRYRLIQVSGLPGSGRTSLVLEGIGSKAGARERAIYVKGGETTFRDMLDRLFAEFSRGYEGSLLNAAFIAGSVANNSGDTVPESADISSDTSAAPDDASAPSAKKNHPVSPESVFRLIGLLNQSAGILIIDDYDLLEDVPDQFSGWMCSYLRSATCIVITSSRSSFVIDPALDSAIVTLTGFTSSTGVEYFRKILSERGEKIAQRDLESLAHSLGGHPLSLRLAAAALVDGASALEAGNRALGGVKGLEKGSGLKSHAKSGRDEQVMDGHDGFILGTLTPEMMSALVSLSVLRVAVPPHTAAIVAGGEAVLSLLDDRYLLERDRGGMIMLHPVVAAAAGKFTDQLIVRNAHGRAAAAFRELNAAGSSGSVGEAGEGAFIFQELEHLYRAGDYAACQGRLVESVDRLLEMSRFSELLEMIEKVALAVGSFHPCLELARATVYRSQGRDDRAAELLEELRSGKLDSLLDSENVIVMRSRAALELSQVYRRAGDFNGALAMVEEAVNFFREQGESMDEARSLFWKGDIYKDLGEYVFAVRLFERALSIFQNMGRASESSMCLNALAVIHKNSGDYPRAMNCMEKSLESARGRGNSFSEAVVLNNMVQLFLLRGDLDSARETNSRCMAIRAALGDRLGIAICLNNSASIHRNLGHYDRALEDMESSLSLKREIGDRRGISYSLNDMAMVHMDRGDYPRAMELFTEALSIKRSLGDQRGVVITLLNLGNIYKDTGEFNLSFRHFSEALEIARLMSLASEEAAILHQMGSFIAGTGDIKQARRYYEDSLAVCEQIGNRKLTAKVLGALAGIHRMRGDSVAAESLCRRCLDIAEETGDLRGRAIALNQLGGLLAQRGDSLAARQIFAQSMQIKKDLDDRRGIIETLIPLAKLDYDQGCTEEGMKGLQEALTIARQLGLTKSAVTATVFLAEGYLILDKNGLAEERLESALNICQEIDYPEGMAFICKTYGKLYQKTGDFEKSHFYINLAIDHYDRLNKLDDIEALKADLESMDRVNLDRLIKDRQGNTMESEVARLNSELLDKYGCVTTVMFTDIVGFTSKTESLSEIDTMSLLKVHDDIAEDAVIKYGGRLVKKIGDSVMACFDSPTSALEAGKSLIWELRRYSEGKPVNLSIEVRVGMNTGLAVRRDNDLFGDVVNTAARICHMGKPGDIVMTGTTYQSLEKRSECTFAGERIIRGKKEPVDLYVWSSLDSEPGNPLFAD
jgi:class 3 adenylate cyclase/Tfp pilus assembly protein PilF